jgi:hypothetical protein
MVHGRRGFLKFQCRFHWTLSASTHHCSVARSFQVCCCRSASSDNRTTARAREKVLFSSPTLVDIWQMHFLLLSGQEYTAPGMFIANSFDAPLTAMPEAPTAPPPQGQQAPPPPQHNGTAYYFKVSALPDGTFTVTNSRNGFSRTCKAEGTRAD